MKQIKFLSILMLVLAGLSFTACSSSDDDENGGEVSEVKIEKLVGVWQVYHIKGWGTENGKPVESEYDVSPENTGADCDRHTFQADGSYQLSYYDTDNGRWKNDGSGYAYTVSGNKIVITHGSRTSHEYTVDKLTKNELVMTRYIEYKDDQFYFKFSMKRVE